MSVSIGQAFTAMSLAKSHNFNVDEFSGSAGYDVIEYGGHKYAPYPPFNPMLMSVTYFFAYGGTKVLGAIVPLDKVFVEVVESVGLGMVDSLAYLGIGILIYLLLRQYKVNSKVIAVVLVGTLFGTVLFNYSVSFFQHVVAAFFVLLSFYLLNKNKSSRFPYLLAGLFAGFAFISEFPTAVFAIAVLIYFLIQRFSKEITSRELLMRIIFFGLGYSVSLLILGTYHYILFGNPLLFAEKVLYARNIAEDKTVHTFSQNPIYGWWGLYLSPLKGLFLISPFLLFSLVGIVKYWRVNRASAVLLISYIVLVSTVYSMWPDCFGFSTFGSRFLITVIPFLCFLSAFALKSRGTIIAYSVLVIFGIYICFFNLLDGIPSGTWFIKCRINEYGSFYKATDFADNLIHGKAVFAPVLLQELMEP